VTKTPPPCGSIGFPCANGKTGSPLPKGEQPHDNHKDATVSGTIYVVPPVVVLLATSGLARRLARRRDRRR
jgi:hypothetical protein